MSGMRRFEVDPAVLASRVGDEIILVHLETDHIFSLNPTASRVWTLLAAGADRESLSRQLQLEFEVPAAQLDSDVDDLLLTLRDHGLLRSPDGS